MEHIKMVRGDTLAFGVEIEGNTQELDTAFFSVKQNKDDTDYFFQKSLDDGISLVSTGENSITYRVRVAPENTENMEPGNYYYDLEIGLNDDIFTVLSGILTIEHDVTRRE